MIGSFASAIDGMLLPVYARVADSPQSLRRLFNLMAKLWSIVGSFLGFGIIIFCPEIVHVLYGAKSGTGHSGVEDHDAVVRDPILTPATPTTTSCCFAGARST